MRARPNENKKIDSKNCEQRYVLLTDCLTLNGLMKHRVLWIDTLSVRNLCADTNINTCHEYINRYRLSNFDVVRTNFNFQITKSVKRAPGSQQELTFDGFVSPKQLNLVCRVPPINYKRCSGRGWGRVLL